MDRMENCNMEYSNKVAVITGGVWIGKSCLTDRDYMQQYILPYPRKIL